MKKSLNIYQMAGVYIRKSTVKEIYSGITLGSSFFVCKYQRPHRCCQFPANLIGDDL